jgi:hypothetical protein
MKIIEIASEEINYHEEKVNGISKWNKYGEWFGLNNVSWCAIFVSWCYARAGYPLGAIDFSKGFASVPYGLNHFKHSNEITKSPQEGDIVIFDWDKDGRPDHTGLFVKDNGDGSIETIEGNTGDGNPSDGGCVMRKTRDKMLVEAYVHPLILDQNV